MDFIQELFHFFKKLGYKRLEYGQEICWLKEEDRCIKLVEIIPELLPGQEKCPVRQTEEVMETLEKELMLRTGKQVDRLTLRLFHDMPDVDIVDEIAPFPNIWCIDRKNGRLFIYEKQRTEFDGIRHRLEDVLLAYTQKEMKNTRQEFQRIFQPVTTVLVLVNLCVFVLLSFKGDVTDASFMAQHGALDWIDVVENKEYYRLITSCFLHFGLDHLLQNMLILILLGSRLERVTGKLRYTAIYFGAGLGASLVSLAYKLSSEINTVSAGASGAVFGIMGGLLFLILKDAFQKKKRHMEEIGLSGIIFMIMAALSFGFFTTGVDNAAHIGGLVAGFILTAFMAVGV